MGVTGTHGIPRLPGSNNYKVLAAGAKRVGYKDFHSGNMAINSEPRDDRPACHQIGFCMSGCAIGAKWSTLYTEIPKAEATGHFELRPDSMALRITHDASGAVTGVIYADKAGNQHEQKARAVCVAGQLGGNAKAAAELGVGEVSGRDGEFIRPGRAQLHAPHERDGVCDHAGPGELRTRHPDGGHRQGRGAFRSQPWLRRRIRDGDAAGLRPRRYGRQPGPRRLGPRLRADHGDV